jgi:hypothetical protein
METNAMNPLLAAVAVRAVTAALVGVSVAGCAASATSAPPPAPTPATTTAHIDYANLLIRPTDINLPGDSFSTPAKPYYAVNGVGMEFVNQDETRKINDTIWVLPDASGSQEKVNGALATVDHIVVGGAPQPVDVGSFGTLVSGTSPDGSTAQTVLVFAEGKAVVELQFESAKNDPVPTEFVMDVGRKQDSAIKSGLPG